MNDLCLYYVIKTSTKTKLFKTIVLINEKSFFYITIICFLTKHNYQKRSFKVI